MSRLKHRVFHNQILSAFWCQTQEKVTPLIASLVWRAEAFKAMFNDKDPLLTRETATAAQAINHFDNTKLTKFLQAFQYTPLKETIQRVCSTLQHQLPPV